MEKTFFENFFGTFFRENFPKIFRNFEIFIFQIDFPKKIFSSFSDLEKIFFEIEKNRIFFLRKVNLKNENFKSSKKFSKKCQLFYSIKMFFDEKFSTKKIIVHLFRSQISPRFQKSYLENHAMSLNTFFSLIPLTSRKIYIFRRVVT